jgi:hypothetical protein
VFAVTCALLVEGGEGAAAAAAADGGGETGTVAAEGGPTVKASVTDGENRHTTAVANNAFLLDRGVVAVVDDEATAELVGLVMALGLFFNLLVTF